MTLFHRLPRPLAGMIAALAVLVGAVVAPFGVPMINHLPSASAATAVNGGGSGFAGLEIQQWQADTARKPYNLSVNYSSLSSGVGRINFASGLYDYGVSDITYQPEESSLVNQITSGRCHGTAGCFKYVPISAGGLSFMYNITIGASRYTSLNLTPTNVCSIFTQQVTMWNDPSLTANNPQLQQDPNPINVVTRSDAAGESFVLSQYCISQAPAVWGRFVAFEKSNPSYEGSQAAELNNDEPISSWPPQLSQANANAFQESGADAVANAVADPQQGKNAITYDAAGYALVRSFPVASVQNKANQFTQPNETNVNVALAYASANSSGTFDLDFNGPDPRAYFPSTYSYAIVQTGGGADAGKSATEAAFLCYAVGKGQTIAPDLRYARLSAQIVNISVAAITALPGAPTAAACTAGAPAAPGAIAVQGGAAAGSTDKAGGAGTSGSGSTADAAAALKAAEAQGETTTTLSPQAKAAAEALEAAKRAAANGSGGGGGGSNSAGDAIWYLILGGIVCGVGFGVAAGARRSS